MAVTYAAACLRCGAIRFANYLLLDTALYLKCAATRLKHADTYHSYRVVIKKTKYVTLYF